MGALEDRPLDDGTLISAAQGGDVGAYEELVRRHQDVAFRCAFLMMRNVDDANDVTQDAFVKAFSALHRFRTGAAFRPWLLTIIGNQARNHRRGRLRRESVALRVAEGVAGRQAASAEDDVLAKERRAELLAAIERLRLEDREVITLRWFGDLSEAEMAALLGHPHGTVKSRLSRAMARLRRELDARHQGRFHG